jgi:uncharacterized protein
MTETSHAAQPLWQRILVPLVRLIVLGGALFYFMAWSEGLLEEYCDRPLLSIPIMLGLGLLAIAL